MASRMAAPIASKAIGVSAARSFTGTARAQNKVCWCVCVCVCARPRMWFCSAVRPLPSHQPALHMQLLWGAG